jgi:hypothetical protein
MNSVPRTDRDISAKHRVSRLAIVGAGFLLMWSARARPEWNLDSVFYAGAALHCLGYSDSDSHRRSYDDLRQVAPLRQFETLVHGSAYRRTVFEYPDAFAAQRRFYLNKPLYVALVAIIIRLGANSIDAAFLISAISYGFLAIVLLEVLLRSRCPVYSSILGVAVLLSPPFRETATLATPDALGSVVTFSAIVSLSVCRHRRVGILLLVASVLARPDNILFCLSVLIWLGLTGHRTYRWALASAALTTTIFIGALLITKPYSWNVVATHTFVASIAWAKDMTGVMTPSLYMTSLWKGLGGAFVLHPSAAPLFIALSIVGCTMATSNSVQRQQTISLIATTWIAAGVHFIVFPMLADRFFLAHYATIVVSVGLGLQTRNAMASASQ